MKFSSPSPSTQAYFYSSRLTLFASLLIHLSGQRGSSTRSGLCCLLCGLCQYSTSLTQELTTICPMNSCSSFSTNSKLSARGPFPALPQGHVVMTLDFFIIILVIFCHRLITSLYKITCQGIYPQDKDPVYYTLCVGTVSGTELMFHKYLKNE